MVLKFYIILLEIFAIAFCISAETTEIRNFGICRTAYNETAICIDLNYCVGLMNILKTGRITSQQKAYLSESQCGYTNNKIQICCAKRFQARQNPSVSKSSLLSSTEDCGCNPPHYNILGGQETDREEHPWTALLMYSNKMSHSLFSFCGGTLINEQYVITAGHCIPRSDADYFLDSVRLGEWNTASNPDCFKFNNDQLDCADMYKDIKIFKVYLHPNFTAQYRNDISLLRLSEKVAYSNMIKPICLPINHGWHDRQLVAENVDVVGWGRKEMGLKSNIKKKATLAIYSNDECSKIYATQGHSVTSNQLCAGGEKGVDSCKGDSGGPLVWLHQDLNRYYLVGITSYGALICGQENWPGVYTRVDKYIDWILNLLEP